MRKQRCRPKHHHLAQPRQRTGCGRTGHPATGRRPHRRPVARCAGHRPRQGNPGCHRNLGIPSGGQRTCHWPRWQGAFGGQTFTTDRKRPALAVAAQDHRHRRPGGGCLLGLGPAIRLACRVHQPEWGRRQENGRYHQGEHRQGRWQWCLSKTRPKPRKSTARRVTTKKKVEEVINVATIRDRFSKRFQITGLDTAEEARNLALLLRAGALAAPVDIVEERTVGPSLGKENIEQGERSFIIGFAAGGLGGLGLLQGVRGHRQFHASVQHGLDSWRSSPRCRPP